MESISGIGCPAPMQRGCFEAAFAEKRSLNMSAIEKWALLIAIVFLIAGGDCAGAVGKSTGTNTMSEVVIDRSNGNREHRVDRDDRIVIRLPENPTTGYLWEEETVDAHVLKPVSSVFYPAGDSMPGAGGMRNFVFEASSPGIATLRFILKRSWEPKQNAIEHFEATIEVRKGRR
jgi:inhibitor of cysteine peptidase